LFILISQERPGLVGPLLRIPDGRVSLAEGERLLREHQRLPDFLLLLRARGQHTKALSLLHQHQYTTDASPLKGPQPLVDYLHNLGRRPFILIIIVFYNEQNCLVPVKLH